MLCKAFAEQDPRPSPNFFRAILFPEGSSPLRFVWAEYTDPGFTSTINQHQFTGKDDDAAMHSPDLVDKLGFGYNISLFHKKSFLGHLQSMSVRTLAPGGIWPGPYLAYGYTHVEKDEDFTDYKPVDLDTAALGPLRYLFLQREAL